LFIGAGSAGVGLVIGTVHDWTPDLGSVVSWQASPASLAKARQAPISDVPVGSMQSAHIGGFCEFADRGLDYARLVTGSWDVPGRCDIRTMSYVINSHLRRHRTYHSWFEYNDAKAIVRHTISDPANINFVPIRHGEMTPTEWRNFVMATPDPLQWDCFRFGLIQHADHFSFFAIVDHLHCDPTILSALYSEILLMYNSLLSGAPPIPLPPPASHDDFCLWEGQYTSALTLDSPPVRKWIEFAEDNGGTLPDFPLPLGDLSVRSGSDVLVEQLMDPEQTARFESICLAAGARFSGGLFACAALAQYELTGAEIYYGITPTDKRRNPAEYAAMGWFTGMIPFAVPVDPTSFRETARAAQASFDANMDLAKVPFSRVLELAPWLRKWGTNFTMINYMDAGLPPLSAVVVSHIDRSNASVYCDPRDPAYVYLSVIRLFDEVSLVVNFQNNPVARESATRYAKAIKAVFTSVADGHDAEISARDVVQT
jgi:mycolipenoyl-CoA---2-(long-chain-fatty acyl)-trehalose mycolipenoyltransferase / long-chain-acyl-CoA---trehalose acyltransferase